MFKTKTTKIIAFLIVLFLLLSATISLADNETASDAVVTSDQLPVQEVENYKKSDVYLVGDNITIDYIVDGNAFICANNVTITSQIGGDAFIIAKNIVVEENGYVFNNLFALAESIEIKGVVYDVYSASKTLTLTSGYVYRDIKSACETFNVNALVGRNVTIACPNINFNTVENANGIIYGNLNYSSNNEISIPEGCVKGEIKYDHIADVPEVSAKEVILDNILDLIKFVVFSVVIWLICLWLAPKFLQNTNQYVGKKTLPTFGWGLLSLFAIPVAGVILILLRLTSSLSFVLFTLYILAIVISKTLFTVTANNYICSKLKLDKNIQTVGMLVVSSIVIWLITLIPYIGSVLSFVIVTLGLGILVKSIIPTKNKDSESEPVVAVKVENEVPETKVIEDVKAEEIKEESKPAKKTTTRSTKSSGTTKSTKTTKTTKSTKSNKTKKEE